MAAIGQTFYNLVDLYKSKNPDGSMATVIEMLMQNNSMLEDAIAVECNNGTNHIHTIRTGLPDVTWGKLYKGIPQSKSAKTQVTDTTGFVEGLSTIDTRILGLSKNKAEVRLSEARSFLEAMEQEVQTRLIYGNTASDPEQFLGLAPRYSSLSAANGNNIIDAGGTGSDNTSIWMVGWGMGRCHLLYPEGMQAGVQRDDKGEQRVTDGNGDPYFAMEELFSHHIGLALADWRYVVRIANVDVSSMIADPSNIDGSNNSVYDFMRKGYRRLQSTQPQKVQTGTEGRVVVYSNADVLEALDALGTNAGANDNMIRLTPMEVQGKMVESYRQLPMRQVDALLNTEARVT